jgi:tetratricopeptide (TPR) repeat protein
MMKRPTGIIFMLICFCIFTVGSKAQVISDPEELFSEGEYFFQSEDYEEALYYFLQLAEKYPDNANFNWKVGNTYLNIPGREYLAIPYLEKAVTNTTIKYRKRSFKEKRAPHHAYFRLGNAYRINNETEKALEVYELFTSSKDFEGNYNLSIVENEIRSCERANIIRDEPVPAEFIKLESPINIESDNTNAVLSGDGNTMIFISELAFYDAIHLSRKIDGQWTEPEVLNPQVGSDGDMYPTSLSYDGRELFLVKREEDNNDIYVSTLGADFWTKARPLGPNINTGADETHASITADGKTLYFTSARRGGYGELDIYRSTRQPSGEWGEAENLGAVINTEFNEETPFLSEDRLYFSSQGHFNMGGYDVFFSMWDEGWKDPVNIGFPVNTTVDDLFYYPIGDGNQGLMSRIERKGAHAYNIFFVRIGERTVEFTDVQAGFPDDFSLILVVPGSKDTITIRYRKDKNMFFPDNPAYKVIRKDR